jgi:hypothetical protein
MITLGTRRDRARLAATLQWRESADQPPIYFTDGVELYRVVRWLDRPAEPRLAEVENCHSLDSVLLSCDDLARLSVRLVTVDGTVTPALPLA